jgi:hypothetical protein
VVFLYHQNGKDASVVGMFGAGLVGIGAEVQFPYRQLLMPQNEAPVPQVLMDLAQQSPHFPPHLRLLVAEPHLPSRE